MLRPVLSRLVLICCLSSSQAIPALAQSSDTMPEALRRLFESLPTPRLPDSLGFPRAGVVAIRALFGFALMRLASALAW